MLLSKGESAYSSHYRFSTAMVWLIWSLSSQVPVKFIERELVRGGCFKYRDKSVVSCHEAFSSLAQFSARGEEQSFGWHYR